MEVRSQGTAGGLSRRDGVVWAEPTLFRCSTIIFLSDVFIKANLYVYRSASCMQYRCQPTVAC